MMEPLIENISDTAKWVAIFRAEETERPDAVFRDPYARKLAGDKGEAIANNIGFSKQNSWSFVARTFAFDEFIQEYVEDGCDMVINLAAGLDTRPYRMPLPSSLQWIEVDLPGILDYKEKILENEKPKCSLERVRQDLSDVVARRELFKTLASGRRSILIVSEGLLPYLDEASVSELAKDLSAQKNFRRWVLDLMSPGLLGMLKKEMKLLEESGSPLRFAPAEGELFYSHYGWRFLKSRSYLKTAARLKRLPDELMQYAALPEPQSPKGMIPWAEVCLFENMNPY